MLRVVIGGSNGGRGKTPPNQIDFTSMQFLVQIGKMIGCPLPTLGLAPPCGKSSIHPLLVVVVVLSCIMKMVEGTCIEISGSRKS